MKSCYLIQRLNKPREETNPFSFGGGLKNGGLSEEAVGLLKNIMSFDYMGSSEFEWGAVPDAFRNLAKAAAGKNLVTGKFTGNGLDIPVYYICLKDQQSALQQWVYDEIRRSNGNTKEHVGFREALKGKKYSPVGWLELDNPWMLFVDMTMWENTCKLFGID